LSWLSLFPKEFESILLEEETTFWNNFTTRRQNGFKIGTRDRKITSGDMQVAVIEPNLHNIA